MPTATMTHVQGTIVLVTFVHIRSISTFTDPILATLFGPNYLGALIFGTKILYDQHLFQPKKFLNQKFVFAENYFGPKSTWTQKDFRTKIFVDTNFNPPKILAISKIM